MDILFVALNRKDFMGSFISETSNYLFVGIISFYVFLNILVFFFKNPGVHKHLYFLQVIFAVLFHAVGYITLFMRSGDVRYFFFFAFQEITMIAIMLLYQTIYPQISKFLLNNMFFLLYIGFVILGRLNFDHAVRQFVITIVMLGLSLLVPFIYRKFKFWDKAGYVYSGIGIFLLGAVWLTGEVTHGSKLAVKILGLSFQPAEFVKISIVFFMAAMLSNRKVVYRYVSSSLFVAIHLIILVFSKDLGSAGIYLATYISMMFLANENPITLLVGGLVSGGGFALAYKMFPHVRIRVKTWRDPWEDINNTGYQITQSLFAIGTGSWFGMGLLKGSPLSIPVVYEDFIFSAISEEMGSLFGILLIILYLLTVLHIFRMGMQVKKPFHKNILVGFGVAIGIQVLLTIGGGTRFIPLTGVTLPLISMGGSSLCATILMFTIIQAIYVDEFAPAEDEENEALEGYEEEFAEDDLVVDHSIEEIEEMEMDEFEEVDDVIEEELTDTNYPVEELSHTKEVVIRHK